MFYGYVLFLLAVGLIIIYEIFKKPYLFWPCVFASTISAADLMFLQYGFVDEFFVACAIVGAMLFLMLDKSSTVTSRRKEKRKLHHEIHLLLFLAMISYMIFQASRGILVLESFQKFHWVIYYGMFGIILFVGSKRVCTYADGRKLVLSITIFSLFYVSQYLVITFITEVIYGMSRWDAQLQGNWIGGSYAMFPLVVTLPAIIYVLIDKSRVRSILGWITLVAAFSAAVISESRATMIPLFFVSLIALPVIGLRKIAFSTVIVSLILIFQLVFFGGIDFSKSTRIVEDLTQTITSNLSVKDDIGRKKDLDRIGHLMVAFKVLHNDFSHALFGYGLRVQGYVMAPYIIEYYHEYLPHLDVIKELGSLDDVATFGFSAILVGTGYIGMILILLNFVLTGYGIFVQSKGYHRTILLSSLAFLLLRLFANNHLSTMLLFVAIMPYGLLHQLSQCQPMTFK